MIYKPKYQHFGENGVIINWPSKIDAQINAEVLRLDLLISKVFKQKIVELVPSYHSLAVYLKEDESVSNFIEQLKQLPMSEQSGTKTVKRLISIPVCYDPIYGLDIDEVAITNDITVKDVIQLHTQEIYKVYFLGFLPGFPYLGGLNESLFTPRKSTPRKNIANGAVAIGGKQTGIYTIDSPGGWNVIGKSPLDFFSCESSLKCLLRPGDFVRFKIVSGNEFKKIEVEVALGNYKVSKEVHHD